MVKYEDCASFVFVNQIRVISMSSERNVEFQTYLDSHSFSIFLQACGPARTYCIRSGDRGRRVKAKALRSDTAILIINTLLPRVWHDFTAFRAVNSSLGESDYN
jgi:hypothetical protein